MDDVVLVVIAALVVLLSAAWLGAPGHAVGWIAVGAVTVGTLVRPRPAGGERSP